MKTPVLMTVDQFNKLKPGDKVTLAASKTEVTVMDYAAWATAAMNPSPEKKFIVYFVTPAGFYGSSHFSYFKYITASAATPPIRSTPMTAKQFKIIKPGHVIRRMGTIDNLVVIDFATYQKNINQSGGKPTPDYIYYKTKGGFNGLGHYSLFELVGTSIATPPSTTKLAPMTHDEFLNLKAGDIIRRVSTKRPVTVMDFNIWVKHISWHSKKPDPDFIYYVIKVNPNNPKNDIYNCQKYKFFAISSTATPKAMSFYEFSNLPVGSRIKSLGGSVEGTTMEYKDWSKQWIIFNKSQPPADMADYIYYLTDSNTYAYNRYDYFTVIKATTQSTLKAMSFNEFVNLPAGSVIERITTHARGLTLEHNDWAKKIVASKQVTTAPSFFPNIMYYLNLVTNLYEFDYFKVFGIVAAKSTSKATPVPTTPIVYGQFKNLPVGSKVGLIGSALTGITMEYSNWKKGLAATSMLKNTPRESGHLYYLADNGNHGHEHYSKLTILHRPSTTPVALASAETEVAPKVDQKTCKHKFVELATSYSCEFCEKDFYQ
jgi:hypothetical protein